MAHDGQSQARLSPMHLAAGRERKPTSERLAAALKGIYRAVDATAGAAAGGLRGWALGPPLSGHRPELAASLERGRAVLCLPCRRTPDLVHHECHRGLECQIAPRRQGQGPTSPPTRLRRSLLYLVLNRSEKEWRMPPREWVMAKAQFAVLFGERFTRAMAA